MDKLLVDLFPAEWRRPTLSGGSLVDIISQKQIFLAKLEALGQKWQSAKPELEMLSTMRPSGPDVDLPELISGLDTWLGALRARGAMLTRQDSALDMEDFTFQTLLHEFRQPPRGLETRALQLHHTALLSLERLLTVDGPLSPEQVNTNRFVESFGRNGKT